MPYLGDKPLSQIASFDIERYKRHRLSQPIQTRKKLAEGETAPITKPATVNREPAALSHLLNKAFEWGWIDRTTARICKLKEGTGRIDFLSSEDAAALLEAAKHDPNLQIYPFILIGLHTGMRKSEILSICRTDIDLANRTVNILRAKAGARQQPISDAVAELLREMLKALPPGTQWLFPSLASRSARTQDIRKAFVRSVVAAGLDPTKVVRHTLRHPPSRISCKLALICPPSNASAATRPWRWLSAMSTSMVPTSKGRWTDSSGVMIAGRPRTFRTDGSAELEALFAGTRQGQLKRREYLLPPHMLSARCSVGEPTVAEASGNGGIAPKPAVRMFVGQRIRSTEAVEKRVSGGGRGAVFRRRGGRDAGRQTGACGLIAGNQVLIAAISGPTPKIAIIRLRL